MNNVFLKLAVLTVTLMTLLTSNAYAADRDSRNDRDTNYKADRQKHSAPQLRLDTRYNHNRSYPREGQLLKVLPNRYRPIHYHDRDYFYVNGVWHLTSGSNLVVTRPPLGIVVSVLPAFYTTIWLRGTPYYYANDIYYTWRPDLSGYQVTAPPTENDQIETTYLADDVFAYPKQGQSEEQQADDRYACHRWGFKQTGYDPTQPPENLSMDELSRKRQDYRRAMKTCLEGKNYSVN